MAARGASAVQGDGQRSDTSCRCASHGFAGADGADPQSTLLPPEAIPPAAMLQLPAGPPLGPLVMPAKSQANMPKAPIANAPVAMKRSMGPRSARGSDDARSMMGRARSTIIPIAMPATPATFPSSASDERSIATPQQALPLPAGYQLTGSPRRAVSTDAIPRSPRARRELAHSSIRQTVDDPATSVARRPQADADASSPHSRAASLRSP